MADIKKAARKTKRFAHKLLAETGIQCSDLPTKNVVLCNAGQATGLDKEILYKTIRNQFPHMITPKYVPKKGQSYSFVIFDTTSSAEEFLESCHAKLKLIANGPPVYINFVNKVPDHTILCSEDTPLGLTVIENFINDDEEQGLFSYFDWNEVTVADHSLGQLKNRQVRHFGYEFRYGSNDVDLSAPLNNTIPTECNLILDRLRTHGITIPGMPDQLTVNKYKPGQGIPSHVDKHSPFGGCILSLSLGGSVIMDWKHRSGKHVPVYVPNKSLLVMQNEARLVWYKSVRVVLETVYHNVSLTALRTSSTQLGRASPDSWPLLQVLLNLMMFAAQQTKRRDKQSQEPLEQPYDWQHGIQARAWDPLIVLHDVPGEDSEIKKVKILSQDERARETRISLTFRWTRRGPCDCSYPTLCDSDPGGTAPIENEVAAHLENLYVHEVYEQIASHFSTTRHKCWPRVEEFLRSVPSGSVIVDLGSGNGKNILNRNDVLQIAAERSSGLLLECKQRLRDIPAADCLRADMLSTPLREAAADAVICIAVIHHFSNQERRIKAISEVARVLRVGGTALITVWARDQTKANYLCKNRDNESKPVSNRQVVAGVNLPVHQNRTQFQHNDLLVPWKLRKVNAQNSEPTGDTLLRYYHVFDEGELDGLCKSVKCLGVVKSFYEQGNWCVICKKM